MSYMQTLCKITYDLTCTENMSDFSHALSWKMSLILQRYSDDFQAILYEQSIINVSPPLLIHPSSNSFVLIRISILSHLSIMLKSCDNHVTMWCLFTWRPCQPEAWSARLSRPACLTLWRRIEWVGRQPLNLALWLVPEQWCQCYHHKVPQRP